MATITSTGFYQLTFAGVPLTIDMGKVFRMKFPTAAGTGPDRLLVPEKHQPEDDVLDEIDRMIPFDYLQDMAKPPDFLGRNLGALASPPSPVWPDVKIGQWYYPNTASKWSVFRFLASSTQVAAMVAAVKGTTISTTPGTDPPNFWLPSDFVMKAIPDGASNSNRGYELITSMYMLPPRPLAEHGGTGALGGGSTFTSTQTYDGLYLITLVDERYYWQWSSVTLHQTQGSTWASLIAQLEAALSVTITTSAISDAYTQPEIDSQLWTNVESAAALFDAVAYNLGRTVVRNLDGSYNLYTPQESKAIAEANRGTLTEEDTFVSSNVIRHAGGDMFQSGATNLRVGDLTTARNPAIPQSLLVTFPYYVIGDDPIPHFLNSRYPNQRPSAWYEESYGSVYSVEVPYTILGQAVSGLIGIVGTSATVQNTAKALIQTESSTVPVNSSGLNYLAEQIATDYYYGQIYDGLDEVYPGTYAWVPEGIHDIVWTYSAKMKQASCRVMRAPWNQFKTTMQHATPRVLLVPVSTGGSSAISGITGVPRGVGGPSVAQSIRDSFGIGITTTLAADMGVSDQAAAFNSVSCFPTQNRWRGQIDGELILFEGTSGGIPISPGAGGGFSVGIVYRAIDGSYATTHPTGNTIRQTIPDATFGVNLSTYEKGQFVYPAEWTSGGIQGLNVVPQTQSIYLTEANGTQINGVYHYSGILQIWDMTAGNWVSRESVWGIERNAMPVASGTRYDGQYVGPSAAPAAPTYALNNATSSGGTIIISSGSSSCVEAYADYPCNLFSSPNPIPGCVLHFTCSCYIGFVVGQSQANVIDIEAYWAGLVVTGGISLGGPTEQTFTNLDRLHFDPNVFLVTQDDPACTTDPVTHQGLFITVKPSGTSLSPHNLLSLTHPDTCPFTPPGLGDLVIGKKECATNPGHTQGVLWTDFPGNLCMDSDGNFPFLFLGETAGLPAWSPSLLYVARSQPFNCCADETDYTCLGKSPELTFDPPQPKIFFEGSCFMNVQTTTATGDNTSCDYRDWGKFIITTMWCGFNVIDESDTLFTKVTTLKFNDDFVISEETPQFACPDDTLLGSILHQQIDIELNPECDGIFGGDEPFTGAVVVISNVSFNSTTCVLSTTFCTLSFCKGRLYTVGSSCQG